MQAETAWSHMAPLWIKGPWYNKNVMDSVTFLCDGDASANKQDGDFIVIESAIFSIDGR